MKTTQRRSSAQWQMLIQQQADSGLGAVQFCRENNLHHQYFSKRKRMLHAPASASASASPDSRFIKVQTVQQPTAVSAMVLHYRNTQLHIPVGADPHALAQLMALLP